MNVLGISRAVLALSVLSASQIAFAFPELVRHGYTNCTTCHVSPSGGGLNTEYGRALSKEVLSTWGREHEENLLHGAVDTSAFSSWLNVGGDVRGIQIFSNSSQRQDARWIWMQADLEAAVSAGRWVFDGTLGRMLARDESVSLGSRRYYAMYRPTDEIAVRAGRFFTAYGLNLPDHNLNVRSLLGFDENQETENVEASFIDETWNVYLTGLRDRGDIAETSRQTGGALQVSRAISDSYKVGANIWDTSSPLTIRKMAGVFGALGFTPHLYVLTENDLKSETTKSADGETAGYYRYTRLGYEFIQGIHGFLHEQFSWTDRSSWNPSQSVGVGFLFYPRPHFEFQGTWNRVTRDPRSETTDLAYLMLHYYL